MTELNQFREDVKTAYSKDQLDAIRAEAAKQGIVIPDADEDLVDYLMAFGEDSNAQLQNNANTWEAKAAGTTERRVNRWQRKQIYQQKLKN